MFKIIIRHVGITAFGIAIGLLNEWLRNNRTIVPLYCVNMRQLSS
ncbi:hypothetical protein QG082_07620 [Kingella kingae]|nr:hypothetical protein [Kingella kingae]MDK4528800.1 hypothetical protein [Kingella kingae]MDK4543362.1 hypothetical protein [Kingella kingae]MDK4562877.1 hypothetical protein [Kingella kingae]MDK4603105.1 hypothetical protein [Kingella kingae]MDK4633083.1 hypothetical protein [Kingella kingae]